MTSIADLRAQVNGLLISVQTTNNELIGTLDQAQSSIASGNADIARRSISTFIQQAVNRSNLPAQNSNRLDAAQANALTCSAANVLLNISAPQ